MSINVQKTRSGEDQKVSEAELQENEERKFLFKMSNGGNNVGNDKNNAFQRRFIAAAMKNKAGRRRFKAVRREFKAPVG